MTRLSIRSKDTKLQAATRDAKALRATVLAIVEDAMGQVEDLLHDAPTTDDAKAAALRVRRSRAVEATATAVVAGVPVATRLVQRHITRRNASRVARVVPFAVRAHPVVFGAAILGGAVVGAGLVRRRLRAGADGRVDTMPRGPFDLDEEVARMEGEGGDLGAYDGAPQPLRGLSRAGNGGGRSGPR